MSVREQAAIVVDRLRTSGPTSFRSLVADADSTLVIVARFLALLRAVQGAGLAFDQEEALGELSVRWTGDDVTAIDVGEEFDEGDEPSTPSTPTPARQEGSDE